MGVNFTGPMTLFTLRGMPVQLHTSFLWLAGLYIVWQAIQGGGAGAIDALIWGCVLFGSVLLHELGHAWAAQIKGIRTHSVVLHPFGGYAALDQQPSGNDEILIAAAGPAVNLVLAGLGFLLVAVHPIFWSLFAINLALGLFNLLPALPLDGGRILRAWWTRSLGYMAATARSQKLSRWIGGGLAVVGLIVNSYGLALVGLYIFWVSGKAPSAPPPRVATVGSARVRAQPPSSGGAMSWLPTLTPAARGLIIANVAVYAVAQVGMASGFDLTGWLQLDGAAVLRGQLWRPFTAMWGSPGLGNLLVSMLMLYLFGSTFEQETSGRRTVSVYILSGLAGSLLVLAVALPVHLSGLSIPYLGLTWGVPLLGPSAAVGGLLAAWCGLYWGQTRTFLLVGQLKVRTMFLILAGITVLSSLLMPAMMFSQVGGLGMGLALGRGNLLSRVNVWWERRRLLARQDEIKQQLSRFEVIDGGRDDDEDPGDDWIH